MEVPDVVERVEKSFLETVEQYGMFQPGDGVIVAVSGGKDSFTLFDLICRLKDTRFPDVRFLACTIQTDITCSGSIPMRTIRKQAAEHGMDFETIYYPIAAEAAENGEEVRCFYCALRRRTALIKLGFKLGYHTIAFGHHLDDLVETLIMNVIHHGNVSTMAPLVHFFEGKIKVVRPLARVAEDDCRSYAESVTIVPPACRCGGLDGMIRETTKQFMAELTRLVPNAKQNLFKVLSR